MEGYNTDSATYANTTQGDTQRQADLAAIETSKGRVVYVFGTGAPKARGEKTAAQIVINRMKDADGSIGGNTVFNIPDGNGGFLKSLSSSW